MFFDVLIDPGGWFAGLVKRCAESTDAGLPVMVVAHVFFT
jgi:hypothetical protein